MENFKIESLTPEVVNFLNNLARGGQNIVVECKNTSQLESSLIMDLEPSVNFKVIGPYNKAKYSDERYQKRTMYTRSQMYHVVSYFEKLEQGIDTSWDDITKASYLYDKLSSVLKPCYEYKEKQGHETRNLYSMFDGVVCAGAALIYQEMCERQNIECDYVRGKTKGEQEVNHAWNVLHIGEDIIPVDLMFEVTNRYKTGDRNIKYFGDSKYFSETHFPDNDERVQKYNNKNVEERLPNNDKCAKLKSVVREDGSKFYLGIVGTLEENNTTLYKYLYSDDFSQFEILYSESNVNELSSAKFKSFCNDLLDKKRIERYLLEHNGYLGCVFENEKGIQKGIDERLYESFNNKEHAKLYIRDDGTSLVLAPGNDKEHNNIGVYNYDCYEFENGEIKINSIYSENKLLQENKYEDFIATNLLDSDRLNQKVKEQGGYIGFVALNNQEIRKFSNNAVEEVIKQSK